MTIYLAADHAGFELKNSLIPWLIELGYTVEDCGASTLDTNDDYPDYVTLCAKKVAENKESFGIVLGASGQGEAMAANRVPGIRAAVYYGNPAKMQTDVEGNELSLLASVRLHNNANVLSLGARFISEEEVKTAVQTFLATSFEGGERHMRRIEKLG